MRTIRAILIDDEAAANKVLSALLADYDDLKVIGQFTDPEEAMGQMGRLKPDVVFLDIEMGKNNGIDLASRLTHGHFLRIVFVTAYAEYAVEAFEVNAIDYLLKPVQKNRLDLTLSKIREAKRRALEEGAENQLNEPIVQVISLNHPAVYNQNQRALVWRTRKARELFFYLWLNDGAAVNKKVLLEKLFPDKDQGKSQVLLHTTVYQLRRGLAEIGFPEAIYYQDESYLLKLPLKSDLEELKNLLDLPDHDSGDLMTILNLYKSGFLESEPYEWAFGPRRVIEERTYRALVKFAGKRLEARDFDDPLPACLERIQRLGPMEEETVSAFLRYYGYRQKLPDLKRYYTTYKRILLKDFATRPQPFLEELYGSFLNP